MIELTKTKEHLTLETQMQKDIIRARDGTISECKKQREMAEQKYQREVDSLRSKIQ